MVFAAVLRPIRLILVALLALGLVTSASAHRMPVDPDQLAFVLATGADPADFCGTLPWDAQPQPLCLVCQIAGALLPEPLPLLTVDLRLAAAGPVLPNAFGPVPAASRDPAHRSQAPPVA